MHLDMGVGPFGSKRSKRPQHLEQTDERGKGVDVESPRLRLQFAAHLRHVEVVLPRRFQPPVRVPHQKRAAAARGVEQGSQAVRSHRLVQYPLDNAGRRIEFAQPLALCGGMNC